MITSFETCCVQSKKEPLTKQEHNTRRAKIVNSTTVGVLGETQYPHNSELLRSSATKTLIILAAIDEFKTRSEAN